MTFLCAVLVFSDTDFYIPNIRFRQLLRELNNVLIQNIIADMYLQSVFIATENCATCKLLLALVFLCFFGKSDIDSESDAPSP